MRTSGKHLHLLLKKLLEKLLKSYKKAFHHFYRQDDAQNDSPKPCQKSNQLKLTNNFNRFLNANTLAKTKEEEIVRVNCGQVKRFRAGK